MFDDFRMNVRHSVDSVRAHDTQMRHVDSFFAIFFDQGHTSHPVQITGIFPYDLLRTIFCDLLISTPKILKVHISPASECSLFCKLFPNV